VLQIVSEEIEKVRKKKPQVCFYDIFNESSQQIVDEIQQKNIVDESSYKNLSCAITIRIPSNHCNTNTIRDTIFVDLTSNDDVPEESIEKDSLQVNEECTDDNNNNDKIVHNEIIPIEEKSEETAKSCGISDDDLKFLIENYNQLHENEQESLIKYLEKLEKSDSSRYNSIAAVQLNNA
jgi:hypothetical protein